VSCSCRSHEACSPDSCFAAKMRYWRESGHSPFKHQPREFFRGPTQRELVKDTIERAEAQGMEIAPVHNRWV